MDAVDEKRSRFIHLKTSLDTILEERGAIERPRWWRRSLEACHDPAWNAEWLETNILLEAYQHLVPAKTFRRMIKLRQHYTELGQENLFQDFKDRVDHLTAPKTLTFHGYVHAFSEDQITETQNHLGEALAPLDQFGCPIFLFAGVLLGLVREGNFLAHDDDVDFGVWLGEVTQEEAASLWAGYKAQLIEAGLAEPGPHSNNAPVFKLNNPRNLSIDLFPAWSTEGRFSIYPFSLDDVAEKDIFPLSIAEGDRLEMFNGYPMPLPRNPEALLAQSYGPTWRTPDPLFRFNWGAAQKRFAPLMTQDYP